MNFKNCTGIVYARITESCCSCTGKEPQKTPGRKAREMCFYPL